MKIRTGFVSNSSSSSFIVVFGEANEKALKLIKENKLEKYVRTGEDILSSRRFDLSFEEMGIYIDVDKSTINPNKNYIQFEKSWGDDSDFCDDDYNYDYDIDLDFFPDSFLKVYNMVNEKNGFKNIHSGYGAGRNG